jgi:hypothetical protein
MSVGWARLYNIMYIVFAYKRNAVLFVVLLNTILGTYIPYLYVQWCNRDLFSTGGGGELLV